MAPQKSVLITGCSDGGIGGALAHVFAQNNLLVFATARTVSKMGSLSEIPNVRLLTLDVTSVSDITAAVEAVKLRTGGTLDYLVNNAALASFSPVLDIDINESKKIFDANCWGPLELTQKFSPLLIAAKGTMVSISSVGGHVNSPYLAAYAASKRSFEMIFDTLRLEIEPFGVKVLNVVNGGVISKAQNSEIRGLKNWKLPEGSLYKPIEETISHRIQEKDGVYGDGGKRTDTMVHAKEVVGRILKGETGKIWCGAGAGAVAFMEKWVPQSFIDKALLSGTGLDQLVAKVAK